jgi:hypothetical protein
LNIGAAVLGLPGAAEIRRDDMPYSEYGNRGPGTFLKWAVIAIVVAALAYLAFFFFIGKAVVGTVTG